MSLQFKTDNKVIAVSAVYDGDLKAVIIYKWVGDCKDQTRTSFSTYLTTQSGSNRGEDQAQPRRWHEGRIEEVG